MADHHGWDSGGFRSPWVGESMLPLLFSSLSTEDYSFLVLGREFLWVCKFAGLGRLWLFSCFYSHLLGRFCGCLWFGGYVNFVEIFGFVIVGFNGFGGFQWQWVCDYLLRWVEILGLNCGWEVASFGELVVVVVGRGFD